MDKFNFPLVTAIDGEPVASSEVIAHGLGLQHKNVLAMIRRYLPDFESFGLVPFQMRPKKAGVRGSSDVEYAMLNEQQATLLIALCRNNPAVVEFKLRLIHSFYDMRKQLAHHDNSLWMRRTVADLLELVGELPPRRSIQ